MEKAPFPFLSVFPVVPDQISFDKLSYIAHLSKLIWSGSSFPATATGKMDKKGKKHPSLPFLIRFPCSSPATATGKMDKKGKKHPSLPFLIRFPCSSPATATGKMDKKGKKHPSLSSLPFLSRFPCSSPATNKLQICFTLSERRSGPKLKLKFTY